MCVFSGCETGQVQQRKALGPVFFPKPPDKPRLQFLTSFTQAQEFREGTASAFEKFIVGQAEAKRKSINKPYGLAIFDGKLYVCDVGLKMVWVLDIETRQFSFLTKDRRLVHPVNIYIESDGRKYVTDIGSGAIFVFDKDNTLDAILARKLKIRPVDIVVRGYYIYVTDGAKQQILVLDKKTGEEIRRFGESGKVAELGKFGLISGLALGSQDNIYATDKLHDGSDQIIKPLFAGADLVEHLSQCQPPFPRR